MKYYVNCSKCGGQIPIKGRYGTVDEIRKNEGEVFVRTCPECGAMRHYAYCDVNAAGSLTIWGAVLEWSLFLSLWLAAIVSSVILFVFLPEMAEAWVDNGSPKIVELFSVLAFAPLVLVFLIFNHKRRFFNRFEKSAKTATFPRMTYRLFDNLYDVELIQWCVRSIPAENRVKTLLQYIFDLNLSDFLFEDETWRKTSDGEYLFIHFLREIGAVKDAEALQALMTEENERVLCSEWTEEEDMQHEDVVKLFDEYFDAGYIEDVESLMIDYLRKNADSFCELY